MPNISLDYYDLIDLIGKDIPMEELIEKVPMMGASIEGVEGDEMEIEFFPNRPDLYCVEGIARALRGFFGIQTGLQTYPIERSDVVLEVDRSVENVRPYVVAGIVKDVVMTDYLVKSLMEVQEKLHATLGRKRAKVSIGVHDFDKVVPPYTYKAVDPKSVKFVPLAKTEMMDMEEILQKHEKGIDYAFILEGLDTYPLIVDKNDDVLSFPPIINGVLTTVTEWTKNIFLDVTGTDLAGCKTALNIIATALAERDAKLESVEIKYHDETLVTPDFNPVVKELKVDYANDWIGVSESAEQIAKHLERMRYGVVVNGDVLEVQIPTYRNDVLHPVDLAEDMAIAFGYENIQDNFPEELTFGSLLPLNDFCAKLSDLLIGYGYQEVSTLTLSSIQEQVGTEEEDITKVRNPISVDHTCVRATLIPSLLNVLRANKHHELPQRIFEVGDVVIKGKNARRLSGLSCHAKSSFTEMKSVVESLLRDVGMESEVKAKRDARFLSGRCAGVFHDGEEIGVFGELHPELITHYDLTNPTSAFEIDVLAIFRE
jgi:phenylalanyl-tRNA synthetase beta chain